MSNNCSFINENTDSYSSNNKNYYQLLNVSPLASDIDIKEAYRKKILLCHPDKRTLPKTIDGSDNSGVVDDWWFHRIQEAYETLRDPKRRLDYDRHLIFLRSKENFSAHHGASSTTTATRISLSTLQCELVDVIIDQHQHPSTDNFVNNDEKNQEHQIPVDSYKVEKLYCLQCRCGEWMEILQSDLTPCTNSNVISTKDHLGSNILHCSSCSLSVWIDVSS